MKGLLAFVVLMMFPARGQSGADPAARSHTERTFEFIAKAPMKVVAPLFGADKERVWAPDWNPSFVWPFEARDRQGMVFTVAHEHQTAVWVNTVYEPLHGRFQYVYVIPGMLVTVIALKLTPQGSASTHVSVEYTRTALSPDANATVEQLAQHDSRGALTWSEQINRYLANPAK